jgi:hypothetical protein
MSSSVGYYYSAVEEEARRVRELRVQFAELRVRHDRARTRAATLKVTVPKAKTVIASDTATLTTAVTELRARVDRAEQELDAAWQVRWRERMRVVTPSAPAATTSAIAELTEHRARSANRSAEQAADRIAEQKRRVVEDAKGWLEASAAQCDPADVDELTGELAALSALERVDDVRSANLRFAERINESKKRRRQREQADEVRATLLALVEDAPEAERAALADSVRAAPDPEVWRTPIHQAVERADVARGRARVAEAAAKALTDAGCAVGWDFATLLSTREEAVVAFDGTPPGYGLLVRLPSDSAQIMAAVVRSDDSDQCDVEAQQGFCDTMLPALVTSLRSGGVRLDERPFVHLRPGEMAVPVLRDGRLRSTGRGRKPEGVQQQPQVVLRERGLPS